VSTRMRLCESPPCNPVFSSYVSDKRMTDETRMALELKSMNVKKRVEWPDLRNGQLGSVWFGKEASNVPGTVPSVGLFWMAPMMTVIVTQPESVL